MLENKKLNMIISLLIAIALWAFVIGEVNPEASRTYRDIPIQFINQETLEASDLAVYSVSQRTINVTITGTRSEVNKVDHKEIIATVDLNDAAMGETPLRVDVKVPSKVEIEAQSINKVTVHVERRVSKEVPVIVSYEGTFNGEEEPITVDQDCSTVTVYGAETTVGQVAAASASVPENSITKEIQEIQCGLIAVNSNGQRVYNVKLSDGDVLVTSELAKLKTVPLHVPMKGGESDGIERTITKPETITIKGKTSDLESIDAISTETIYLDKVVTSTTIPLVPVLPEGVAVSKESAGLEIVIQVTKLGTQKLSFDQSAVELRGLKNGFTAHAEDTAIELILTGSENVIEALSKSDVSMFVDLSGLKEGRHKVDLQVVCAAGEPTINVNPKKITVIIKAEEQDNEITQPEDNTDDSKPDSDEEQTDNKENNNDDNMNDDNHNEE